MKRNNLVIFTSVLLVILFTGCSVKAPQYNSSADNVVELRKINSKLNVGKFTATVSEKKILCRLARTVTIANNMSFEEYIENAFVEDLKMADKYSSESNITISANLNKLSVSSGLADTGYWKFDVTLSSSNGRSFDIISEYIYETSFVGAIACNEHMPNAFKPAVQKLIKEILAHPKFKSLIQE